MMFRLRTALLLVLLATLAIAREEWCEEEHDHDDDHDDENTDDHDDEHSDEHDDEHDDEHGDELLPHAEDFLVELFHEYGNSNSCTILEEDFERLVDDLKVGGTDTDGDEHDSHERRRRDVSHSRHRRSAHHSCYNSEQLLTIYNVSHEEGVQQSEFLQISAALIHQVLLGCVQEEEHEEEEEDELSSAEIYGYGTISVVAVSACAPVGLVIMRWYSSPAYKYIMAVMLSLAVGALTGDALIHLIPHGLELHAHEMGGHAHSEEAEIKIEIFIWKMFVVCGAIWAFLNMQLLFNAIGRKRMGSTDKIALELDVESTSGSGLSSDVKVEQSVGWMITIGDGVHNFVDGLAIGVAYTVSWRTGVSTTIAVFVHELAHEFGDTAALLAIGWSWKTVLLLQILAQVPAFVGLYIGIPIAVESHNAQQWILCIAAGMFLYIALCNIVPELMVFFKAYSMLIMVFCINIGLAIGFGAMFVLGAFEEHIEV